jgi:hypothetical protein
MTIKYRDWFQHYVMNKIIVYTRTFYIHVISVAAQSKAWVSDVRLLGLRVRIRLGEWMSVSCD